MIDGDVIWECGSNACTAPILGHRWNGETYDPPEYCMRDAVPHTDRCEDHDGEALFEQWQNDWNPEDNYECEHTND